MDAYKRQRLDWKRAKEEAKQKGLPFSKKPFKNKPVIAIVFYHGKQKWKDYHFADQFDLPEDWLKEFIPDVKIFVIDMSKFTDAYIEKIGTSFLQPMLYLFKHKGDKTFVKQNTEKIFNFVEGLTDDKFTREFLKTIFYFMIQTFNLEREEVKELVEYLPIKNQYNMDMLEETAVNAFDEYMQKGQEINEIKKNVEIILMLLQTFPDIDDTNIALICKVKRPFVSKVRKTFQTDKEASIKRFVRTVYKNIPFISEAEFLKMEKMTIKLWKSFKKHTSRPL